MAFQERGETQEGSVPDHWLWRSQAECSFSDARAGTMSVAPARAAARMSERTSSRSWA